MADIVHNAGVLSSKIPFKVSARTAKLIGLENFSNEEGAVIELVKNAYDADAKNCILIFDLKYKSADVGQDDDVQVIDKINSKIYIVDNGVGMTAPVISNQWMTIGTDDKLFKYTSEFGRVKTGAKGIGRFALNRLGMVTYLQTVSKETKQGLEWLVNWQDFDKKGATVSDVEAIMTERNNLDLKAELVAKFNSSKRISDLVNNNSFDSGTIIEISELNDAWDEKQLIKLFGNLEVLLPPREQSDFYIDLFSLSSPEEYGTVKTAFYDDFDYKIEAKYDEDDSGNLAVSITRNELDVGALQNKYVELFDYEAMKHFPFRLEDFKAKTITIRKPISSILSSDVDKALIEKVGKFSFSFYFLKNNLSDDKADGNLKKYPYKSFNGANRKSWLKKFGGVKIFRDDFRIRPYGENGDDWLRLGERQSQNPGGPGQRLGGYRIGPNQISGTISISRLYNQSFQDKSGREGIIENDVFDLFKNIIKETIALFERDRNTVMFYLSQLHKDKNKKEEALRKAQEEAEKIKRAQEAEQASVNQKQQDEEQKKEPSAENTESNHSNSSNYSERERILADGIDILTQDSDKKDNEIRLLRSLASVGLIISSFAHEVKSLRSRLIPRTKHLLQELSHHLDEPSLSEVDKDDNPYFMIRLIQEEDTKLKHWLDYSLNTLKRDKRERTNLDFADYFSRFKASWNKALNQRNISLEIEGEENGSCILQAFEVDIDSIFNNLLSNSISALNGIKNNEKLIRIVWKKWDQNIEITFSDNGKGLDMKYRESPDEMFNLNETSKKDNKGDTIGTGLGLYIVRSIIEEYNNSSISVEQLDKGLQFKIVFKSRK